MRNHVKTAHARHRDIADYEFIIRSQPTAPAPLPPSQQRSAVVFAVKEIRENCRYLWLIINNKNAWCTSPDIFPTPTLGAFRDNCTL